MRERSRFPAGSRSLPARGDPRGSDRPDGLRLLHGGPHGRALPRRLLSLPAQEVRKGAANELSEAN